MCGLTISTDVHTQVTNTQAETQKVTPEAPKSASKTVCLGEQFPALGNGLPA